MFVYVKKAAMCGTDHQPKPPALPYMRHNARGEIPVFLWYRRYYIQVLQGDDLIPRSRLFVFARQREVLLWGSFEQKPGFCLSKNPVFAQPARRLGAF